MTLEEALSADYVDINVLDTLKDHKYVINKKTPKHLLCISEVIYNSLENNFAETMNFLSKNLTTLKLLNKDRKRFISILRSKKYYFMKNHLVYVKIIPDLLLCTLNDDFDATIKELLLTRDNKKIELSNSDRNALRKILVNNKFILTKETIPLILKNGEFLLVSLKNDYATTMKVLKECKYKVELSIEENKELSKILLNNGFVYSNETPSIFKDKIGAVIAGINKNIRLTLTYFDYNIVRLKEEKDWLYEVLENNMVPYTSYTQEMIKDSYLLSKFIKNKEEIDFIVNRILPKEVEYNIEDEKKLLRFLNSKSNTVEDELKLMHDKDLYRDSLSVTQFLVFAMYIKKQMYKEGIKDYSINLFDYNKQVERNILGEILKDKLSLYNVEFNRSIFSILSTLHHEFYHLVQFKDIREGRIAKDRDVDIYSKDEFITKFTPEEQYYNNNYRSISYEFDADFKAFMMTANLLGVDGEGYLNSQMGINEEDLIDYSRLTTTYNQNTIRVYHGKETHLNDIFDEVLKKEIKEQGKNNFYYYLKYNYPIITYDYRFDGEEVKRRSIKELVSLMDSFDNQESRVICAYLLEKRLDYQDAEYEKNEKELIELSKNNYRTPQTKILINKIITNAYSRRCNRYFKYIEMLLRVRNKKVDNKH